MPDNYNPVIRNLAVDVQENFIASTIETFGDVLDDLNTKNSYQGNLLKRRINRINTAVSPALSASFGYQGTDQWVQIFWAPEPIAKPVCSDGKTFYLGSKLAWELFIENIAQDVDSLNISFDGISFLLDRGDHILYFGATETISELLNNRECLGLLSSSSINVRQQTTPVRDSTVIFVLGTILGATVSGLLFSIALGLFDMLH